jgi:hypothetical protein
MNAQITLTNANFPAIGDTLKTATDLSPEGITADPPGGPYTWNYSSLSADTRQVVSFQAASTGSDFIHFPTADLVATSGPGAETYYDVSSSLFATLGFSGGDVAGGFNFVTYVAFTPPFPERYAPTNFFDIHQSQSDFYYAVALADLPAGVLDSLGIPTGLIDSFRLRVTIERLGVADAFGTLTIPGGTHDVLRLHYTDYTTTGMDVHIPFLGWVDVGTLGVPVEGLGTDTTTTYTYYSNNAKEPIASMTMAEPNGLVPAEVEFKDYGLPSAVDDITNEKIGVTISPNPASDIITFQLKDVKTDSYSISLFDVQGRHIISKKLTADQESFSIRSWLNGVYLYQVLNGQNKIVASGKWMKAD